MKIIAVLVALYLLNFASSYYLHKTYIKALKRVRKFGQVSTARTRGGLRKKAYIALLAFDDEGIIQYGEIFRGLTVFTKFKEIEKIKGLTLDEMESKFADNQAVMQAVEYIRQKFEENKETSIDTEEITENI